MDGSLDGEPINLNGTCQDAQNETIDFSMDPEETFTEITTICLEEGQDYKLKFTFDRYDPAVPDPAKNIFIDSVSFHFLIGHCHFTKMDLKKKRALLKNQITLTKYRLYNPHNGNMVCGVFKRGVQN